MNPDEALDAFRKDAIRLEREMAVVLESMANLRDLDFVVPLSALEEQLVATESAALPINAIRA